MHSSLRAGSTTAPTARPIAGQTSIGSVSLTVADLPRATLFYEHVLGLQAVHRDDGNVALSAGGDRVLVELHGDPSATPRNPRAPGLFHMAILCPTARRSRWPWRAWTALAGPSPAPRITS